MKLSAVACFETKTLGEAYALINELLERLELEVLDCSPMAVGRCFTLLAGEEQAIQQAVSKLKDQVLDLYEIQNVRETLLNGVFSLLSQPVLESLLIVEVPSLPYLLKQAQEICEHDDSVKIIEIRPYRSSQTQAIGIFTGPRSVLEPLANLLTREIGDGIHFLKNCSPRFLQFYNISGA